MKLEHIGIAVDDLEAAIKHYETLFNAGCYKREIVKEQKVETAFFQTGSSKVELLGATEASSVIAKFVNKKGEGLHHVAFEVDDIHGEMKRLRAAGYTLLDEEPREGADDKLIAFLHPGDQHGVLIEICQPKR